MINPPQRIIWMLDKTLVRTNPPHWSTMRQITTEFINQFGNPDMKHIIADPEPLLENLGENLIGKQFSCVIDLSGWMAKALGSNILRTEEVITEFRLSRIRQVSSPSLPTSGYILSSNSQRIHQLKTRLDLSKPLILDDTSFSGTTSLIAMKILGINSEEATHGFLIVNEGNLGENPGAKTALENIQASVVSGMSMKTPEDDGWHVEDIWHHPQLESALNSSRLLQEMIEEQGINSPETKAVWETRAFLSTLFPGQIQPEDMKKLSQEGRLITLKEDWQNEIHTTNPFLWASPYFIQHINWPAITDNFETVTELLLSIQSLAGESLVPRRESIQELKRGIEGHISNMSKERI